MFARTMAPETQKAIQGRQKQSVVKKVFDGILNAMLPDLWCILYMIHTFGLICKFASIAD